MCWQHCSRAYTVENENITLSVRYSSAYSLLWYRQLHHTAVPQFLMFILQSSGKVVQSSNKRLSGKLNAESKRVDLIIPSSTVQDSAVYYCPLQTTVTGKQTLLYKNLTGWVTEIKMCSLHVHLYCYSLEISIKFVQRLLCSTKNFSFFCTVTNDCTHIFV